MECEMIYHRLMQKSRFLRLIKINLFYSLLLNDLQLHQFYFVSQTLIILLFLYDYLPAKSTKFNFPAVIISEFPYFY